MSERCQAKTEISHLGRCVFSIWCALDADHVTEGTLHFDDLAKIWWRKDSDREERFGD